MARIRTVKPVQQFGIARDAGQHASVGRLTTSARLLWVALAGVADRTGAVGVAGLLGNVAWLAPDLEEDELGAMVDELRSAGLVTYAPDGDLVLLHHGDLWRTVRQKPERTSLSKIAAYRHLYRDPCAYCAAPADALDHILPLAAGGTDEDGMNLTAACRACNSRKRSRPLLHFLLELHA
jgi:hypothetical protein